MGEGGGPYQPDRLGLTQGGVGRCLHRDLEMRAVRAHGELWGRGAAALGVPKSEGLANPQPGTAGKAMKPGGRRPSSVCVSPQIETSRPFWRRQGEMASPWSDAESAERWGGGERRAGTPGVMRAAENRRSQRKRWGQQQQGVWTGIGSCATQTGPTTTTPCRPRGPPPFHLPRQDGGGREQLRRGHWWAANERLCRLRAEGAAPVHLGPIRLQDAVERLRVLHLREGGPDPRALPPSKSGAGSWRWGIPKEKATRQAQRGVQRSSVQRQAALEM